MAYDRSVLRSRGAAPLRVLALAAVLTAALLALMGSGVRPGGPGPMEPSSFRGGGGYWLLAKDGGVFAFGDAKFFGPNRNQGRDIAGMAATATGNGYWTVDDDGDVFAYGDAIGYGSRPGPEIDDITGFAVRSQGDGYWMVAKDGSVYAFGAAGFFGSASTLSLTKPIVGMAGTPSGKGYWLIAGDGGVFAFGDAGFFGSTGDIRLNRPIVDFGPSADGKGYRFIGNDGGVFAYGGASFHGSTGAISLNQPIVGFAATATGKGYWLVGEDGGVFAFGDAEFYGSTGGLELNAPIVAIVATPRIKVAPIAKNDAATAVEDGSVTIDVEANDTHVLPASVSITTEPAHGTATVSAGKVVFSPAADYNGPDSFKYTLTDTAGHSATATVSVTVTAVNDTPTISVIADQTTSEDAPTGSLTIAVGDVETAAGSLTMSGSSGNTTLIPNGDIVFGGSGESRTVIVTPAANQSGTADITVTVSDGNGGTASDTFALTVTAENDSPTISDIADQSTNQDTATTDSSFTVGDVETAAGSLTVTGASSDTTLVPNGNIVFGGSGSDRTVRVTPAPGESGTATITVTVTDANTASASDSFVLTVNATPTISAIPDVKVSEDTATGQLAFTVGDDETLAGDLVVTASSSDQLVVADGDIVLGDSGISRTVTITPATGASGPTTITITVEDGDGGTATETFTVTVAIGEQPDPHEDNVSLTAALLGIDVLANDLGISDGPLTVEIVAGTLPESEGTADIVNGTQIQLLTALDGDTDGLISFQYKVTDADGDFAIGTVNVSLI